MCLLLKFMSYQYAGIMCIEDFLKCIKWESVKMLQLLCGRLNLCRLFDLRKLCFLKKVFTASNNVLLACGQNFYTSIKYEALCRDYRYFTDVCKLSISA